MDLEPHHADPSLKGKLRRRLVRLQHRKAAGPRLGPPLISFSFDDAPVSAFTTGARVLERYGARGTYFVCAGTAGQTGYIGQMGDRADMLHAQAAGHEVACHTYSHLDCGLADAATTAGDVDRNTRTLENWGLMRPETFAYPYGDVGPRAKRVLAERFSLARAIHHGVIEAGADLAQAPSIGVEGEDGEATALHWMDQAVRRKAWLILYTHGVADGFTPYGCTTAVFERLVGAAVARDFEIVTVAEGARRMRPS
ncbi:polysaccharide deacetylase family protein [Caulobacter sp. S45]|uniref:polysaccharide deacetylase family protein n=1 Tax=Caulobacter sp. S45 TaxID=1641861 RepID=UPI0015751C10|nr:polysaccharide deacetylase family protein [Caulobacter sp. S45]